MPSKSNTTTNRYGSIAAEIYDIDKPFGALPDTEFHLARLAGLPGPVLEPACGTGRTLIPLLEAGLEAAGFDPSSEMLERCRSRCDDRGFTPDLTAQRFEDFHYDRAFAAILVPVGSFTLIDDFEAALAVLGRFRDHLTAGGLLIIDIDPLSSLAGRGEDRRTWTAADGDLLTIEGQRLKVDWLTQREERLVRYERWREGALIESQIEPMAQRHWSAREFRLALETVGFGEIGVTGGYRRRPPRSGDTVLTFEAVRR
jgi:SAM-dependent methyltransferase